MPIGPLGSLPLSSTPASTIFLVHNGTIHYPRHGEHTIAGALSHRGRTHSHAHGRGAIIGGVQAAALKPAESLLIDCEQSRIHTDRAASLMLARDWARILSTDIYSDPVGQRLMLAPLPFTDDWTTTTTGDFARLAKSAFQTKSSGSWASLGSDWVEHQVGIPGNVYLHAMNVNHAVRTSSGSSIANRGVFLSWFQYNTDQEFVAMECGWGDEADATALISFRFFASGRVEVYRLGSVIAEGQVGGSKFDPGLDSQPNQPTRAAQTFVGVVIMFASRNELLILDTQGGGFSVVLDWQADDGSAPPTWIPASTRFWIYVPTGQATFQFAWLSHRRTGTALFTKSYFDDKPLAGQAFGSGRWWDYPRAGHGTTVTITLKDEAGTGTFDQGSDDVGRISAVLTGGGAETAYLYAAEAAFDPIIAATDSSLEFDLMPYVVRLSLEVPEDPAGLTLRAELSGLERIENAGGDRLREVSNRPIRFKIGPNVVFEGQTEPLDWFEAINDEARRPVIECRSRWKTLEQYLFHHPFPTDGELVEDMFVRFVRDSGAAWPEDIEADPTGVRIPQGAQASTGEWNALVEVGDNADGAIRRLIESYAGNWLYGEFPGGTAAKFKLIDPELVGDAPIATLWPTIAEGYAWLVGQGVPEADARERAYEAVYSSFREERFEPEATRVFVTGVDLRTKRPFRAVRARRDLEDPTITPTSRPEGWVGEIRRYGFVDPHITTYDVADRGADILEQRLMSVRRMAEWECEMILLTERPAWRGDCIRLAGKGIYRIKALAVDFLKPVCDEDQWQRRKARYVGEWVAEDE